MCDIFPGMAGLGVNSVYLVFYLLSQSISTGQDPPMDDWCNTFLALICQIAHSKPSSNPFPDKCFSNTGHPVIYRPISIVFCQTYAHRISSCNLIVFCQTSARRISSRNLPSYFIMVSILGFAGWLINGFWIGYLLQ